jgi:hypothetical protein
MAAGRRGRRYSSSDPSTNQLSGALSRNHTVLPGFGSLGMTPQWDESRSMMTKPRPEVAVAAGSLTRVDGIASPSS